MLNSMLNSLWILNLNLALVKKEYQKAFENQNIKIFTIP